MTILTVDMKPVPRNPAEWLAEIASAYADAFETLPFMPLVDMSPDEGALFHLAPQVAIKFRGLTDQQLAIATEAALSSYVASQEQVGAALDEPDIAFAFCYLAAQFGVELLTEQTIAEVMAYLEDNRETFLRTIAKSKTMHSHYRPRPNQSFEGTAGKRSLPVLRRLRRRVAPQTKR